MNDQVCSIEDCKRQVLATGLCASHYATARMARIRAERRAVVRQCRHCGASFSGRSPKAVYCSARCKDAAHGGGKKPNRGACLACGASLAGRRVDAVTCGPTCSQRHRDAEKLKRAKDGRVCRGCLDLMPEAKSLRAEFCSVECRIRSRRHEAYGMTKDELGLLLAQHEACAVCGSSDWGRKGPQVDHCHKTGKVRGILCSSCNNGLGRFRDDPARLRAAADYLER